MPNGPVMFPCSQAGSGGFFRSIGRQSAILAKTLFTNRFPRLSPIRTDPRNQVRGLGFPND